MNALLICPAERSEVAALAEATALANISLLGNPFVHYWLEHLAARGFKDVKILAADRPEEIRRFVGNGARWGLRAEVVPQSDEPTCEEALQRFGPGEAIVIDHLPGFPERKLFMSYADFFGALEFLFSRSAGQTQLGMKEIQPGVWVGMRTQLSPGAVLQAPCWIGKNVLVHSDAKLGPRTFIENGSIVERGAAISESWIGADTLVGSLTQVQTSLTTGDTLMDYRNDSWVKICDAFLLCGLSNKKLHGKTGGLFGQCAALAVLALTFPFALVSMWKAHRSGQRPLRARRAAAPHFATQQNSILYYELTSAHSWWKRWPQLWNVARGEFNWIGNRPLTHIEAGKLSNDFERLWLASPIGLISQGDAEGCADLSSDEARAHASFYAVQANWRLNLRIFCRALKRLITRTIAVAPPTEEAEIKQRPFTFAAR